VQGEDAGREKEGGLIDGRPARAKVGGKGNVAGWLAGWLAGHVKERKKRTAAARGQRKKGRRKQGGVCMKTWGRDEASPKERRKM